MAQPHLLASYLLLIAAGPETSASLADKLNVSPRQVNRYVLQLIEAGWQIERVVSGSSTITTFSHGTNHRAACEAETNQKRTPSSKNK